MKGDECPTPSPECFLEPYQSNFNDQRPRAMPRRSKSLFGLCWSLDPTVLDFEARSTSSHRRPLGQLSISMTIIKQILRCWTRVVLCAPSTRKFRAPSTRKLRAPYFPFRVTVSSTVLSIRNMIPPSFRFLLLLGSFPTLILGNWFVSCREDPNINVPPRCFGDFVAGTNTRCDDNGVYYAPLMTGRTSKRDPNCRRCECI